MRVPLRPLALVSAVVLVCAWAAPAWARNTNVVIESSSEVGVKEAVEKEDKFAVPLDDETSLGFNEDGDPAVSRQF